MRGRRKVATFDNKKIKQWMQDLFKVPEDVTDDFLSDGNGKRLLERMIQRRLKDLQFGKIQTDDFFTTFLEKMIDQRIQVRLQRGEITGKGNHFVVQNCASVQICTSGQNIVKSVVKKKSPRLDPQDQQSVRRIEENEETTALKEPVKSGGTERSMQFNTADKSDDKEDLKFHKEAAAPGVEAVQHLLSVAGQLCSQASEFISLASQLVSTAKSSSLFGKSNVSSPYVNEVYEDTKEIHTMANKLGDIGRALSAESGSDSFVNPLTETGQALRYEDGADDNGIELSDAEDDLCVDSIDDGGQIVDQDILDSFAESEGLGSRNGQNSSTPEFSSSEKENGFENPVCGDRSERWADLFEDSGSSIEVSIDFEFAVAVDSPGEGSARSEVEQTTTKEAQEEDPVNRGKEGMNEESKEEMNEDTEAKQAGGGGGGKGGTAEREEGGGGGGGGNFWPRMETHPSLPATKRPRTFSSARFEHSENSIGKGGGVTGSFPWKIDWTF